MGRIMRDGALTRDEATRRVMKTVARSAGTPPLRAKDGTFPIVVSLPYENISEVVRRVDNVGGSANVAIAFVDHFAMLAMGRDLEEPSDSELLISHDISMGMFMIKVQNNPGKTVALRFRNVDADVPSISFDLAYN
jgi:hypothetical protein